MVIGERELAAVLVAFIVAAALTPAIRNLALSWDRVDEPNHRSTHSAPVPRLGGSAIVFATVIGVGVGMGHFEGWMLGIGIGAILVAVTGTLDDLKHLGPFQKFLPQVGAALLAVILLEPRILVDLPFGSITLSTQLSAAVAVLWIVSVINAFNFIDGLDGLAAGVGLVVALVLASLLSGSVPLLLPFAAALGGFLMWNTAPASIFMGDGGSQFIGYLLASAVLMPSPDDTGAVPVLFAFVPVLCDAIVTIGRRLLAGSSPFSADRNHVFHGFVDTGVSHRAVAIAYTGLTAFSGLAGLAYFHANSLGKLGLLLIMVIVCGSAVIKFSRHARPLWRPRAFMRPNPVVQSTGAWSRSSHG